MNPGPDFMAGRPPVPRFRRTPARPPLPRGTEPRTLLMPCAVGQRDSPLAPGDKWSRYDDPLQLAWTADAIVLSHQARSAPAAAPAAHVPAVTRTSS